MRLDSIEVQNFFNYQYDHLDLTTKGSPLLVQGENGAGKSSLFNEALIFAIFGETRMNSVDDAIRNGATEMAVAVKFNLGGQDVEIMRTKKRGKSAKLTLTVDGVATEELLSETQARINKMFGLSLESFLSSIILKQEDADFFVKQKPDERKKIIGEILDLGQYERLEKIARDQRAALKSEIKIEDMAYQNIEVKDSVVLGDKLKALNQYALMFEQQLEVARKELEAATAANALVEQQIRAASEVRNRNKQLRDMMNNLTRKIEGAKQEIAKVAHLLADANDHADEIGQQEAVIMYYEEEIVRAEGDLKERIQDEVAARKDKLSKVINHMLHQLMEQRNEAAKPLQELMTTKKIEEARLAKIQSLHDPECPTCFRKVDADEHQRIIADIQEEIMRLDSQIVVAQEPVREVQAKIEDLRAENLPEITAVKKKIEEAEASIKEDAQKIADKKSELLNLRTLLKKKIELQQQYQQAKQKSDLLNAQIVEDNNTFAALEEQIQPELVVNAELTQTTTLNAKISDLETKRTQAVKAATTVEAEIEQNDVCIKRKTELETILRDKKHRIDLLDKLCTAFSRKGIPAAIIETVLPEIQEIANHFLARMSQNRLAIQFRTTEVQKNGNEKDTLEVEVFDGVEWRRFESFSGGEQFRISLSIRLALSKVLARRANIDLQVLVLDEAATSLDTSGRDEFIETVLSLRNDFSRIILMSHIPGLADEFEHRINIVKTSNGSKILK